MTNASTAAQLRQAIFETDDLGGEAVHVPRWGKGGMDLFVKGLTAGERNAVIAEARKPEGGMDLDIYVPRIVQLCTYTPDGEERVFAADDLGLILGLGPANLDLLQEPALRLSGLNTKGDEANAVEEAGKDSSSTKSGESSSK